MAWFRRKNKIDDAIEAGQLDRAIELTSRLGDGRASKDHRQQLTEALIQRAKEVAEVDRLPAAWQAISQAASFADTRQNELVSQTTQQLQEQTLKAADRNLQAGQNQQAVDLVQLLSERSLCDQRGDQIGTVAKLLTTTDRLASAGKPDEAIENLESVQRLYPELAGMEERIAEQQKRKKQLGSLADALQSAALSCKWKEVCLLCDQILELAPEHEIALGAKRHARQRVKRRTSVGSRLTNVPESKKDDNLFVPPTAAANCSAGTVDSSLRDTSAPHTTGGLNAVSKDVSGSPAGSSDSANTKFAAGKDARETTSFLIWVDGVGGYLVCTKPVNFIGQAVEDALVSIPLQADVRQRHARIETIAGQHVIQPLGAVAIDGREVPVDESIAIKTGQQISLGTRVRLSYWQDHPLSKSARLDFVSRHRTLPWSDGVILAAQSIILGPNPNNHIFCPNWKSNLVLFRRSGKWFAKCNLEFCVDEQALANESEIQFDSRLYGDSFSLKLEPVFLNN